MNRTVRILFGGCLLGIMSWLPASTGMADGPKSLRLGKVELQQNGSGFRKKGLLTLYSGALYLQKPSSNAAAIIKADEPMAVRIKITSGFVSQKKMLQALEEGFEKSTGGKTKPISNQIKQLRECFSDSIQKNDVFVLSYLPGSGVLIHKNGKHIGRIKGAEFKQALFGIWLSSSPADKGLKRAMLGK